jgi:hypothetical protein
VEEAFRGGDNALKHKLEAWITPDLSGEGAERPLLTRTSGAPHPRAEVGCCLPLAPIYEDSPSWWHSAIASLGSFSTLSPLIQSIPLANVQPASGQERLPTGSTSACMGVTQRRGRIQKNQLSDARVGRANAAALRALATALCCFYEGVYP